VPWTVFVGLVRDPDRRPERPDGDERRRAPWPRPPWQPFAWVAVLCWMTWLAKELDGLAGYVVFLVALSIGCWRLDRWLGSLYWGGLTKR
jgi:hypothetical protein